MGLDPTWRFLLGALRPGAWSASERSRLETLAEMIDSEALALRAARAAVTPVLYDHLESNRMLTPLAPSLVDRLSKTHRAVWARNLFLLRELTRTAKGWAEAGHEAILLKGSAFADYGAESLLKIRAMSDIDLMVRAEKMDAFIDTLIEMGFTDPHAEKKEAYYRSDLQHPPLLSPTRFPYELHYNILVHHQVDAESLWEKSVSGQWEGTRTLAFDDHLYYQLLHVHHHKMEPNAVVKLISDWAYLLDDLDAAPDWTAILDRAQREGSLSALGEVFEVIATLCEAALPIPALAEAVHTPRARCGSVEGHPADYYLNEEKWVAVDRRVAEFRREMSDSHPLKRAKLLFLKVFPPPRDLVFYHRLERFLPWGPILYLARPPILMYKTLKYWSGKRRLDP